MSFISITSTPETFRDPETYPFLKKDRDLLTRAESKSFRCIDTLITGLVLSLITLLGGLCLMYFGQEFFTAINPSIFNVSGEVLMGIAALVLGVTLYRSAMRWRLTQKSIKGQKELFRNALENVLKKEIAQHPELCPKDHWFGFKYFQKQTCTYYVTNGSSEKRLTERSSLSAEEKYVDANQFFTALKNHNKQASNS